LIPQGFIGNSDNVLTHPWIKGLGVAQAGESMELECHSINLSFSSKLFSLSLENLLSE